MVSSFFEALTAGLLYNGVYLTGTIYKVLTLTASAGLTSFSILVVLYILYLLCSVGQNFQDKVRIVVKEMNIKLFYIYGARY